MPWISARRARALFLADFSARGLKSLRQNATSGIYALDFREARALFLADFSARGLSHPVLRQNLLPGIFAPDFREACVRYFWLT